MKPKLLPLLLGVSAIVVAGTLLFVSFAGVHLRIAQAGYFVALLLGVISLVSAVSDEPGQEAARTILDLAVSIAVGVALVGAKDPGDVSEELAQAAMIGLVLFAFQSNSRFHKRTKDLVTDFSKIAGQFTTAENRLRPLLHEAGYAALAARALGIEMEKLNPDRAIGDPTQKAIEASLVSTRTWLNVASSLAKPTKSVPGKEGDRQGEDAGPLWASLAWLRAMHIYQREETYDFGKTELATNVRNYAFILLGLIEQFADDKEHQVVTLQCSPFPPKDFYNFPFGTEKQRSYREAEFFGTYRRGLAQLVKRQTNLRPLRVFLTKRGNVEAVPVGWPLDRTEDFVWHAARTCFIPSPVDVSDTSEIGRLLLRHHRDVRDGLKVSEGSRRGKRLFAPLFTDFTNAELESGDARTRALETDKDKRYLNDVMGRWEEVKTFVQQAADARLVAARSSLDAALQEFEKPVNESEPNDSVRAIYKTMKGHHASLESALGTPSSLVAGLRHAQDLDATLEQLRSALALKRNAGEVAPAERVLHAALAKSEAQQFCKSQGRPTPSWHLFLTDMLGLASNDVTGDAGEDFALSRVRILQFSKDILDLQRQVESEEIFPEFLLFGVRRKKVGPTGNALGTDDEIRDLADVDWQVMVGTQMSDPLVTCRVDLRFKGDTELDAHVAWAQRLWTDKVTRQQTEEILGSIDRELRLSMGAKRATSS